MIIHFTVQMFYEFLGILLYFMVLKKNIKRCLTPFIINENEVFFKDWEV